MDGSPWLQSDVKVGHIWKMGHPVLGSLQAHRIVGIAHRRADSRDSATYPSTPAELDEDSLSILEDHQNKFSQEGLLNRLRFQAIDCPITPGRWRAVVITAARSQTTPENFGRPITGSTCRPRGLAGVKTPRLP